LVRAALEECIHMGPETARPAETRLAARVPEQSVEARRAALAEAKRAVAAAEALAGEYVAGTRTQAEAMAELRRRFSWLDDTAGEDDLAERLGSYGYYLAIM
jgi:hypothetical protein